MRDEQHLQLGKQALLDLDIDGLLDLPEIVQEIKAMWPEADRSLRFAPSAPTVILMTGVNGVGKTTSIAKLARDRAQALIADRENDLQQVRFEARHQYYEAKTYQGPSDRNLTELSLALGYML